MSSPFFLDVEQLLTLLMAELPESVYATDRADDPNYDNRSYSSSELRAHAQIFANLYSNLQSINQDQWISTVTPDGLASWEKELFGTIQDGSLPFLNRQNNLLAKRRALGSIALPAIQAIVSGLLTPLGLTFDILPLCGQNNGTLYGAWILAYSGLGLDTFLALRDPLWGAQQDFVPLDCSLNYTAAGITAQDLADIQATAYTYEVRIYGVADSITLARLDALLTAAEPARSTHIIVNNAPGPVDPSVLDGGGPGSDTIIDSIDFGNGSAAATYDTWDFEATG